MTYENQIEEILKESKNELIIQTKNALKEKIMSSMDWQLSNQISNIVKEFIEQNLKDDIQKAVLDSKQEIINSITPIFASVGAELAKAMQTKVVKVMSDGWKADKIIKSLFE
jgi:SLT domain-containing protein